MFLSPALQAELMEREALPGEFARRVETLWGPLANWIAGRHAAAGAPRVIGLCGPQGSGKTTGAEAMRLMLTERGLNTVVLALDDLYLGKAERTELALRVHPLFATRGPPGTHDVALGLGALSALQKAGKMRLPHFDKATDDRAPMEQWPTVAGPADIVIFEGWCVGAVAQEAVELAAPVNALEAEEDPAGVWRRHVNAALAGDYQRLFGRIDGLIQLRAPSFAVVADWRLEQERKLRARTGMGMSDAEVRRFIQHYERLTRHIDAEMPCRADVVANLGDDRAVRTLELAER